MQSQILVLVFMSYRFYYTKVAFYFRKASPRRIVENLWKTIRRFSRPIL